MREKLDRNHLTGIYHLLCGNRVTVVVGWGGVGGGPAISENGHSNLEGRGLVRNHSETINDQEGETKNEILGESVGGEAAISNLGGAEMRGYHLIWKRRRRR